VWDNNEGIHRRAELGSSTSGTVARSRAQTWNSPSELNNNESRSSQFQKRHFNSTYSDSAPSTPTSDKKGPPPGRPSAPKPVFKPATRAATLGTNQAVALYTFHAAEPGDLGFKKGDIITITKRTDSKNDWWTGQVDGRTGIFPSNYVESL